jgi:hypothetical protein
MNEVDIAFEKRMYGHGQEMAPSLILDTSSLGVESCVERVTSFLATVRSPPA